MLGDLPIPLTGGAIGLLLLIVSYPYIQMARGQLVPRATLEAQERAHEREMELVKHDANEWRAEGRIKDQTITEINEQNTILLREVAPSMNQLFAALRQVGAEARQDGTP